MQADDAAAPPAARRTTKATSNAAPKAKAAEGGCETCDRRPSRESAAAEGRHDESAPKAAGQVENRCRDAASKKSAIAPASTSSKHRRHAPGRRAGPLPPRRSRVAATASTSSRRSRRRQGGDRAARKGQAVAGAPSCRARISDPVARKLVEWAILRSDDNDGRLLPLRRLHHRESDLAEHRPAAAARRGDALAGPARSRDRCAPISARTGRSPPRASLRSPAHCCCKATAPAPQSLVREAWRNDNFSAELEGQVLDVFGGPDHQRRPQGAHGHAPLRRGRRRRLARGQPRRRPRAGDRQGAHRGDQEGGATPRRCSTLCRPTRAATSATSSAASSCCAAPTRSPKPAELILSVPHDPAQAIDTDQWWIERRARRPQAARRRRPQDRLSRRPRRRRCPTRTTIAPSTSSRPAGSRCASSTIRPPRSPISPRSARAPPTRSRSRAPATGRAAPPRRSAARTKRARTTRPRRAIRPPITARSPAPGSASSDIALRPSAAPLRIGATAATRGRARHRDALRHRRTRPGRRRRWPIWATRSSDVAAPRGDRARSPRTHHDARAMLLLGKPALGTRPAARSLRLPDHRPARTIARSVRRSSRPWPMPSRGRKAPSIQKTVSSANAMGLMQVTPAAGQIHRQEVQRALRREAPAAAIRSTTCRSARPSSAT